MARDRGSLRHGPAGAPRLLIRLPTGAEAARHSVAPHPSSLPCRRARPAAPGGREAPLRGGAAERTGGPEPAPDRGRDVRARPHSRGGLHPRGRGGAGQDHRGRSRHRPTACGRREPRADRGAAAPARPVAERAARAVRDGGPGRGGRRRGRGRAGRVRRRARVRGRRAGRRAVARGAAVRPVPDRRSARGVRRHPPALRPRRRLRRKQPPCPHRAPGAGDHRSRAGAAADRHAHAELAGRAVGAGAVHRPQRHAAGRQADLRPVVQPRRGRRAGERTAAAPETGGAAHAAPPGRAVPGAALRRASRATVPVPHAPGGEGALRRRHRVSARTGNRGVPGPRAAVAVDRLPAPDGLVHPCAGQKSGGRGGATAPAAGGRRRRGRRGPGRSGGGSRRPCARGALPGVRR